MTEEPPLSKLFGLGMQELMSAGLDFDKVAKETIREVFGESPYGALLPKLDEPEQSPSTFVQRLAAILPVSIIRTLILLTARRAMKSLTSVPRSYPQYQLLMRKLQASPPPQPERKGLRPLHDHREEDELDKLVGHKTD